MLCKTFDELIAAINENKHPSITFAPSSITFAPPYESFNNPRSLKNHELNQTTIPLLNEALKNNQTLKELDLTAALIKPAGLILLVEGIESNHSITTLSLDEKRIMNDGEILYTTRWAPSTALKKAFSDIKLALNLNQRIEKNITAAISIISRSNKEDLLAPNSKNDLLNALDIVAKYSLDESTLQQMITAVLSSSWVTNSPLVNIEKNVPTALPLLFSLFIKNKTIFVFLLSTLVNTDKEWWIAYRVMLNPDNGLFKDNKADFDNALSHFIAGAKIRGPKNKEELRLTALTIPIEFLNTVWERIEDRYLLLTNTKCDKNTGLPPVEEQRKIIDAIIKENSLRKNAMKALDQFKQKVHAKGNDRLNLPEMANESLKLLNHFSTIALETKDLARIFELFMGTGYEGKDKKKQSLLVKIAKGVPKEDTVANNAPKSDTAENNAPKNDTAANNAPKSNIAENNGPKNNTAANNAPKSDTAENNAPQNGKLEIDPSIVFTRFFDLFWQNDDNDHTKLNEVLSTRFSNGLNGRETIKLYEPQLLASLNTIIKNKLDMTERTLLLDGTLSWIINPTSIKPTARLYATGKLKNIEFISKEELPMKANANAHELEQENSTKFIPRKFA